MEVTCSFCGRVHHGAFLWDAADLEAFECECGAWWYDGMPDKDGECDG